MAAISRPTPTPLRRAPLRDRALPALRSRARLPAVRARPSSLVPRAASKLALIATGANLPHPDKVKKGGEDAWFVRVGKNGGGEMYVADGVGGFNEQGVDPGLYARVLCYEAAKAKDAASRNPLARADPKRLIQAAQEATKLPGASTMVCVEVDGSKLKAANLGDSGFRVVRGGEVVFASAAQEHYFNCPYQLGYEPLSEDTDTAADAESYEFAVKPGDLVVAGSDGLFDNVFDEDIARIATAAAASVRGALGAQRREGGVRTARGDGHGKRRRTRRRVAVRRGGGGGRAAAGRPTQQGPMLHQRARRRRRAAVRATIEEKMDDITVVVGAVVATDAAKRAFRRRREGEREAAVKEADARRRRAPRADATR